MLYLVRQFPINAKCPLLPLILHHLFLSCESLGLLLEKMGTANPRGGETAVQPSAEAVLWMNQLSVVVPRSLTKSMLQIGGNCYFISKY